MNADFRRESGLRHKCQKAFGLAVINEWKDR